MSKKGRKRRQQAIERGVYATKQVNTPAPVAMSNSRIRPIAVGMPTAEMEACEAIHPIEHNPPQPESKPKKLIEPLVSITPSPVSEPKELINPLVSITPSPVSEPTEVIHLLARDQISPVQSVSCTEYMHEDADWLFEDTTNVSGFFDKPQKHCHAQQLPYDLPAFVTGSPKMDDTTIAEKNVKAMNEALAPKAPDGTPLSPPAEGQFVKAKLAVFRSPAIPTPENPVNPLVSASEFADGKLPSDLEYVDGYVTTKVLPNGKQYLSTIYADPVRNLTADQRAALELGQKMMQAPPIKEKETSISEEVPTLSRSDGLDLVIDCPKDCCLYFDSKKGLVKFTNFRLIALESRLIIGKQGTKESTVEYMIQILCGGISRTITLAPSELDNAVRKIQTELPSCIVLPGMQKSHIYIANYIRQKLLDLPQKVYVQRTGFLKLSSVWTYAHDRAVPPDPNTVFDTGRYIPDNRCVSDVQAFRNAMDFLDICRKDELIIPLFLLAHLGPMFQLFHEAGRTPRFVTVLAGRSGSLKTSMSLVLFRLFHDQGQTPTASFRDTEVAMEIKLGELYGCTGIFDDFRPPVSDLKSKANAEKLEGIVRAVGDHVAKSRSNTKLGKAKEFIPSGCALVTAEDLSGSQSSLLRCLVLSIAKGDVDGSKLRRFQNDPNLITAHMSRFVNWVGIHGEETLELIRNHYPNHLFEGVVTELRLVDTAATLMATAQILVAYATAIGAMDQAQAHQFTQRCYNAIRTAIVASESMSKEANPCTMYLDAFFHLVERGEIRLAENITCYSAECHDGYLAAGFAWVDAHTVYAKVRQYFNRLNTVFPLTENQLSVHLADAELIELSYENRNGAQKRLFTKKSSLPSRKRMQVIDIERAKVYLEENANA